MFILRCFFIARHDRQFSKRTNQLFIKSSSNLALDHFRGSFCLHDQAFVGHTNLRIVRLTIEISFPLLRAIQRLRESDVVLIQLHWAWRHNFTLLQALVRDIWKVAPLLISLERVFILMFGCSPNRRHFFILNSYRIRRVAFLIEPYEVGAWVLFMGQIVEEFFLSLRFALGVCIFVVRRIDLLNYSRFFQIGHLR